MVSTVMEYINISFIIPGESSLYIKASIQYMGIRVKTHKWLTC